MGNKALKLMGNKTLKLMGNQALKNWICSISRNTSPVLFWPN